MPGIRHNFFISILLHSLMIAAAFIAGSSSELKVKRQINVSLVEELKSGIQGNGPEDSFQQPRPKIKSVKAANSPPRTQVNTPPDISARKEPVVSTPEAAIGPSSAIAGKVATPANSAIAPSGIPGAGSNAAPVASGTVFAAQGKPMGYAGTMSDITGSQQQQSSPGDASLRQKIRDRIQSNLVYPYIARKKRIEGTVLVAFRINQAGMSEEFRIIRSSGYAVLDTAAKETVVKASPFPPLDKAIEIPITFLLKNN